MLRKIEKSAKLKAMGLLLFMSVVCCLMTVIRIYRAENMTYLFLVWNLVLAWVPLLLAYWLYRLFQYRPQKRLALLLLGCLWLLFFPNAPYIITDLIHLEDKAGTALLFDAVLIFMFALTGLLAGFASLYLVHRILDQLMHERLSWLLITGCLVLSGYGVYLGRVLRWNSWDILTNLPSLLRDVVKMAMNPTAIGITALFSFAMLFSYVTLHRFISLGSSLRSDIRRRGYVEKPFKR